MPNSVKKSVKFNELPPKHQKTKKRDILDMDDEEIDELIANKEHAYHYKKQYADGRKQREYQNHIRRNLEIPPQVWEYLDNSHGPTVKYVHPLDLQTGPEIEANMNALTNRGPNIHGKNRVLAIWGGRKSRKGKKSRKSRKSKKNRH